jgi:uracil-DNA glycosylase family 4
MFVGDFPSITTPENGKPFSDRKGMILRTALRQVENMYRAVEGGAERWVSLPIYQTNTVQCVCEEKTLKKEAIIHCVNLHLNPRIATVQPRLLVVFGAKAFNALGIPKVNFGDVRGSFCDYRFQTTNGSQTIRTFVTFSPDAVLAKPGIYNELVRDLRTAFAFVEGRKVPKLTEEELVKGYDLPQTVEEVEAICKHIVGYAQEGKDPASHLIGVDSETSSLEMYDPDAKIIMASFSWEPGKATAILMDHPKATWTPEEAQRVRTAVRSVIESDKPKVLHNEKFDRQAFCFNKNYRWDMKNVAWDTMLCEHLIEEDKKGNYGLKILTRTRLPQYADYDDKVTELRDAHGGKTRGQEGKRYRKAVLKYEEETESVRNTLVQYKLDIEKYEKEIAAWNERRVSERTAARAKKQKLNKASYGLKPTKPKKVHEPTPPEHREPFDYTMIPIPQLTLYAAIDADVCRQHVLHQNMRMNAEYKRDLEIRTRHHFSAPQPIKRLIQRHCLPLSRTLAQMEFTGFPVDLKYLEQLDNDLKVKIKKTEAELYNMAGEFTIASPKDVIDILFQKGFRDPNKGPEKVTVPKTAALQLTATGQVKTDEKALLYIHNTLGFAFPKTLLTYRKAAKARNPFLVNVYEQAQFDGRMHSQFHIPGTATGRLSSSDENLQNIPKKLAGFNIKKIFIPPEGMVLVNTDAKGAEMRLFTAYSGDEKLIKSLLDGLDTHSYFVSQIWKQFTYDDVENARALIDNWYAGNRTPGEAAFKDAESLVKRRTNCKRVVFGTLYGALAKKIAETAGIPVEEAQEVIDLMFRLFPTVPAYIQSTQNEVALCGSVYTKTGRKRRFPLATVRMFRNRSFRQAVNFKIQSTSSDIVLWVLNRLAPIITKDLRGELHATVHDSITFSVPKKYLSQVPDLMYKHGTEAVATEFPWLPVPFIWDIEAGTNYGEAINIKQYLEGINVEQEIAKQQEELITGGEIREEINDDLRD